MSCSSFSEVRWKAVPLQLNTIRIRGAVGRGRAAPRMACTSRRRVAEPRAPPSAGLLERLVHPLLQLRPVGAVGLLELVEERQALRLVERTQRGAPTRCGPAWGCASRRRPGCGGGGVPVGVDVDQLQPVADARFTPCWARSRAPACSGAAMRRTSIPARAAKPRSRRRRARTSRGTRSSAGGRAGPGCRRSRETVGFELALRDLLVPEPALGGPKTGACRGASAGPRSWCGRICGPFSFRW